MLGQRPGWMELVAFDAVAVITERACGDRFSALAGPPSPVWMTEARAYAGVTGLFRFSPGGHVERALAVKAVGNNRPLVVSPAPPLLAPQLAATALAAPPVKPDGLQATGGVGLQRITGGS